MPDIFEGTPDSRQSAADTLDDTVGGRVFRKRYRQLDSNEIALHDAIKNKAAELYNLIDIVPNKEGAPRMKALAKTKLEESVQWAVKGLTS